jgi:hypothetical protein
MICGTGRVQFDIAAFPAERFVCIDLPMAVINRPGFTDWEVR